MTKRTLYTFIFLVTICQIGFSQILNTSEKYSFSFETPVELKLYDTESVRVVGYENDEAYMKCKQLKN